MGKIRLDSRLSAVADLVREGKKVADIGTDHAYLLAFLLQQGKIKTGIAADLRKGPLDNAKKTLLEAGVLDKVRLVLSDGLDELSECDCEDIVIAGMGGILIKDILERTPWVYNKNIHIIAQPMTHAEVLRGFFLENGFRILRESSATDGKRYYCIISAQYDGVKRNSEEWYTYVGELIRNCDEVSQMYINKTVAALEKKLDAMKNAGVEDALLLADTVATLKQKITEENNG